MRMYKVLILPLAEEDIMNNTDYIAFEKKAPETALELAMGFRNTIAKIEFMPKQHELDEDEELAAREIRKCYYKNYKIYFFIDERSSTVCAESFTYVGKCKTVIAEYEVVILYQSCTNFVPIH